MLFGETAVLLLFVEVTSVGRTLSEKPSGNSPLQGVAGGLGWCLDSNMT